MINQEEINRLNNKVDVAFASPFVGDVIFSEKEINELTTLALESIHKDGHFYFDYYLTPIDLETAKRIFIIIIHITQAECCDDISGSWYDEIALGLKVYGFAYINDIAGFLNRVLSALRNATFILDGRRIRTTFMIHSFVPTWSMESLFEFCWNLYFNPYELNRQYIDEPDLYISYAREFRRRFFPNSKTEESSTHRIDFDGKAYKFRIGLIETVKNRNDDFGYLFDRTILSIDQLVNGGSVDISSSYFNLLINTWYQNKLSSSSKNIDESKNKVTEFSSARSGYGITLVPKIYFCLMGNSLNLFVSHFNLFSNHDINSHVELHIKENGIDIISDSIPIKEKSLSLLSETEDKLVPMDAFINLHSDFLFNLSIDIIDENGKYILDDYPIYRDFILFAEGHLESEVSKRKNNPGMYIVFCTSKIKETLTDVFSEISNFYCVNFKDGDSVIGQNSSCEFCFSNYDDLFSLFPLTKSDKYFYNGTSYSIITTLYLRFDKLVNIERFGFIYTEYGEQQKTTIIPLAVDNNLNLETSYDDKRFETTFTGLKEGAPFDIKLVPLNDVSNVITEIQGIYFSDLDISYSSDLCLDESLDYAIKVSGRVYSRGEISADSDIPVYIDFMNGKLALNSVPLLKIKIGDETYPYYRFPNYFYYENIPIDSSISVNSQVLNIYIIFGETSHIFNYKNFGQEINSLALLDSTPYKLKLSLRFFHNSYENIPLADIYFRPTFLTPPVVLSHDENGQALLHWAPSDFIGPNNPQFSIELINQSTGSKYKYSNFDMNECDITISNIDAGKYSYYVFLNDNDEFISFGYFTYGSEEEIRLAETIYISRCHIHDHKPKLYASSDYQKKLGTTYAIANSKKVYSSNGDFLFYIGHLYKEVPHSEHLTRVDRISKDSISIVIWRPCKDEPNWNIELRFFDSQYEQDSDFESGRIFAITKYSDSLATVGSFDELKEKSDFLYELVNVISDFKLGI